MENVVATIQRWTEILAPYPALQALVTVVAFVILAAVVDRLISGIVSKAVARTETDLDDRILALLHRPIFATVALIGVLLFSTLHPGLL